LGDDVPLNLDPIDRAGCSAPAPALEMRRPHKPSTCWAMMFR
jgi:hypothetical protein